MAKKKLYAVDLVNGMTLIGRCNFKEKSFNTIEDYILIPTENLVSTENRSYRNAAKKVY